MHFYETTVKIRTTIRVEAESLDEAHRIIDGVLDNASFVIVRECPDDNPDDFDDELVGDADTITRGSIERCLD